MRKVWLAGGVALVLVGASPPAFATGECVGQDSLASDDCSIRFIAQRRVAMFAPPVEQPYLSQWTVEVDGKPIVTRSPDGGCRKFGRRGPLRVREVTCTGDVQVFVRSTGPKLTVRFAWANA